MRPARSSRPVTSVRPFSVSTSSVAFPWISPRRAILVLHVLPHLVSCVRLRVGVHAPRHHIRRIISMPKSTMYVCVPSAVSSVSLSVTEHRPLRLLSQLLTSLAHTVCTIASTHSLLGNVRLCGQHFFVETKLKGRLDRCKMSTDANTDHNYSALHDRCSCIHTDCRFSRLPTDQTGGGMDADGPPGAIGTIGMM